MKFSKLALLIQGEQDIDRKDDSLHNKYNKFSLIRHAFFSSGLMSVFYSKIKKLVTSAFNRALHPERYETNLFALVWYYFIGHIYRLLRPSSVISLPFLGDAAIAHASHYRVAVIMHCYYVDLLDEILLYLKNIHVDYTLYVSTNTIDQQTIITAKLQKEGFKQYEVRLAENRGRDIAPKLITFRDVYDRHDYFIHLHTKKSSHLGLFGDEWRRYLLSSLLGSREIVANILSILTHPEVGIVFPDPFEFNVAQLRWDNNFEKASQLAARLDIPISKSFCPEFPVGSMFWGKSKAIRPLLEFGLKLDDFAEEKSQYDGELGHAIERMFVPIVNSQGFYAQRISLLKNRKFIRIKNDIDLNNAINFCKKKENW